MCLIQTTVDATVSNTCEIPRVTALTCVTLHKSATFVNGPMACVCLCTIVHICVAVAGVSYRMYICTYVRTVICTRNIPIY